MSEFENTHKTIIILFPNNGDKKNDPVVYIARDREKVTSYSRPSMRPLDYVYLKKKSI